MIRKIKKTVLLLLVTAVILCSTVVASAEDNDNARSSSGISYLHQNYPNGSYSVDGYACVGCHGTKDDNYKHKGSFFDCNSTLTYEQFLQHISTISGYCKKDGTVNG